MLIDFVGKRIEAIMYFKRFCFFNSFNQLEMLGLGFRFGISGCVVISGDLNRSPTQAASVGDGGWSVRDS